MPCTTQPSQEEIRRMDAWHDVIVRLACDRCKELEKRGTVPEWAQEWWSYHKKEDENRVAQSKLAKEQAKIRQNAIRKLTPKEREELGV